MQLIMPLIILTAAITPDGAGLTYNEHVNVALAVAMPDGGLITPVIKDADKTDIYQMSRYVAAQQLMVHFSLVTAI